MKTHHDVLGQPIRIGNYVVVANNSHSAAGMATLVVGVVTACGAARVVVQHDIVVRPPPSDTPSALPRRHRRLPSRLVVLSNRGAAILKMKGCVLSGNVVTVPRRNTGILEDINGDRIKVGQLVVTTRSDPNGGRRLLVGHVTRTTAKRVFLELVAGDLYGNTKRADPAYVMILEGRINLPFEVDLS